MQRQRGDHQATRRGQVQVWRAVQLEQGQAGWGLAQSELKPVHLDKQLNRHRIEAPSDDGWQEQQLVLVMPEVEVQPDQQD